MKSRTKTNSNHRGGKAPNKNPTGSPPTLSPQLVNTPACIGMPTPSDPPPPPPQHNTTTRLPPSGPHKRISIRNKPARRITSFQVDAWREINVNAATLGDRDTSGYSLSGACMNSRFWDQLLLSRARTGTGTGTDVGRRSHRGLITMSHIATVTPLETAGRQESI